MSGVVSGLVLAAGTSSRLAEQTKQLLPWQDTTMLGWVVRRAEDSILDEVVVVVGHEADSDSSPRGSATREVCGGT